MNHIEACRVCLATEVKFYYLGQHPLLDTYFGPITERDPLVDLPMYVCYECTAYIKKLYFFREKCLRGQAAYYDILQKHGKLSINEIKQVDRWSLNLNSNLVVQNIVAIDADNTGYEVDIDIKLELENADNEPETNEIVDLDSFDSIKLELENTDNEPEKNKMGDLDSCHTIEDVEVKTEDDFLTISSPTPAVYSSDDEPLSVHKTNKDKRGIKKKKKKFVTDRNIIVKENLNKDHTDLDESSSLSELPAVELKRKRGRPKKALSGNVKSKPRRRRTNNTDGVPDEDLSDVDQYVDVVQLTVEEQMEEIIKRKESSNYINAQYKCDLCYKGFTDTSAWKYHVGKHAASAGDFECPICKSRFKNKRILQKHAANHKWKYSCKSCSFISKTKTQAKRHQQWHKGVTYKCDYCDEVSTKWTTYKSHVRNKHPSEFICSVCGYSFVSKLGLHLHKTMMHKDVVEEDESDEECKEKGLYCAQCDVQFISEEAWKRHMVTSVKHNQSLHFSNGCRECGETFKSAEEVRVHQRKEHGRKRVKPSQPNMSWPSKCEHCDEEIPSARAYWLHFRRVHPDKKYPVQKSYTCEICDKSFGSNAFLKYHKRTHSDERAYKCKQCPKAFFNRTNLQMHEKTHSDHRPYPCTVCFKAFKCKGSLDRHFMSHTGLKPYECSFCGKAFGQSNSCKLHVRRVHMKKGSAAFRGRGLWIRSD